MVMVSAAEGGGGKVKVDVGSMSGQSSSIASTVSSRVSGYMSTIGALNDFVGAGSLQGAAYSAAKTYAGSILVAYYQANILYAETVADCAAELVTLYASICGSESLDQEVLEAQLAAYDTSISNTEANLRETRRKERDNELYAESGDSLRIQKQLSHLRSERSAVQSKLDKLLQFNASSSTVFSKADDSASLVSEAEATISASFGAKSFSMPANASWVNTVRGQWSDREQGVTKRYEAALAKVQNGESLTPEDVTAIERYQAAYPDKVNQEAVKAAEAYRVESRYQAAVSKVNNGQELSKSDVKAIEAYQKAHPDAKIDKKVIKATETYKNKEIKAAYKKFSDSYKAGDKLSQKDIRLIEAYKKAYPNAQIDSSIMAAFMSVASNSKTGKQMKKDMAKYLAEVNDDRWENTKKAAGEVVDALFGSVTTVGAEKTVEKSNNGIFATYVKLSDETVVEEDGIFKIKTYNDNFSGIEIDLGFASADVEAKNWHLNTESNFSLFGYEAGGKSSLGVDTENTFMGIPVFELNQSIGYGVENEWHQDWGRKLSTDLDNGILGGYGNYSDITKIDEYTTKISGTEAGFKTVNKVEALAIAVVVGIIFAPEITIPALGGGSIPVLAGG